MQVYFIILLIPAALSKLITLDTKIIGGNDADPNEYPWQISLQFQSSTTNPFSHICGAVVLDAQRILTAAHCVDHDMVREKYRIVAAEHVLNGDSGLEQIRSVSQIKKHASYSGTGGFNNDLAVLILSTPLTLNQYVQPVTLPLSSQQFTNRNCYISGWGRTVAGGPVANVLQEANTNVIDHSTCRSSLGFTGILYLSSTDHICIYTGSNSACNGDSGGPLVCDVSVTSTPNWQLAGITSWGLVDCPVGSPSVYVRVTNYISWINAQ